MVEYTEKDMSLTDLVAEERHPELRRQGYQRLVKAIRWLKDVVAPMNDPSAMVRIR